MNKNTNATKLKKENEITKDSLAVAIQRMECGEYGDGVRERFERQGGPLQFRTLCKYALISGDYETANALSGFYFSR